MIVLSCVSKGFKNNSDNLRVISDLSFNFHDKTIYSIIGPSGCGKTTLIKMILGAVKEDKGSITLFGKSRDKYLEKNKIGVVFQNTSFFPWKTVIENILFPLEFYKANITHDDIQKGEMLMDIFGIIEAKDMYGYELSGGMLQRAAVARALISDPKILILDEPFSSIDEFTKEGLWVEFRRIWKEQGLTVIMISHDIREAVFFC